MNDALALDFIDNTVDISANIVLIVAIAFPTSSSLLVVFSSRNNMLNEKLTEEEMPTEEGMVFPPPANEPESPVYLPAFSSKVPQRWIYSPVISLEMEMSDKVLRNGRCTSEVASTIDKIVAQ